MDNSVFTDIAVSVIVPTYNVAPLLGRCLDSLVGQTLQNIEIICIDDKSTDETLDVLRDYARRDIRIRIIEMDTNGGAAVARNAGVEIARGRYLAFVDSDDFVDADWLQTLYDVACATDADIVKSNVRMVRVNGTSFDGDDLNDRIRSFGKWRFIGSWWSAIYRTKMVRENNIRFPVGVISAQDAVFQTECLKYANKIELCPNTFYHYIRRADSLDSAYLSPAKIQSKLHAEMMMFRIYNSANMAIDDYLFCCGRRFNYTVGLMRRNTSASVRREIAESIICMYASCMYPHQLLTMCSGGAIDATCVKYLQSHDTEKLMRRILYNMSGRCTSGNKTLCYIFGIPVIRVKRGTTSVKIRLFGVLDVIRLKHRRSRTRLDVLYIPVLYIKKL